MGKRFSFNGLFDSVSKLVTEEKVTERKQSPQEKSHRQEIENSVMVLAAAVIRCDRNFSEETEVFLLDYLVRQFGEQGKKQRLNAISTHIETGTEPYTKIACKELKMLTTVDSHLNILQFLFGVAAADDFINAKETRCIHRIAGYLGISDKDFKELKQSYLSKNNPYHLLEVEENATMQEIKVAYRKMMLKYHPDKRQSHVSEKEASENFRAIQKAFEAIRSEREKG